MAKIKKTKFDEGPVNVGEQRLQDFLREKLPDDYIIVPNCNIAATTPKNVVKVWEYDCIVIAPHAVFHIENKDWGGNLEGDDFAWFRNGQEVANPFNGAEKKSRILASQIRNNHPDWNFGAIITIVTLSNPRQSKFGLDPYCNTYKQIFTLNDELLNFIENPEVIKKEAGCIKPWQQDIADFLSGASVEKKFEEKTKIFEYKIIEKLQETDDFTEYLCEPYLIATAKYKIREFPLLVKDKSPQELDELKKKVQNASSAQKKMGLSPYIVTTECRMNEEDTYFYEISRYQDESTLRAKLRLKTFTQTDKLSIIIDVANALKTAAAHNVIHRNVCPENIYVYEGGKAALANFGSAWFVEHKDYDYTVFYNIDQGTPYIAPEVLENDAFQNSDLFSLGVIFYELMIGKVPFESSNIFKISMGQILTDDLLPSNVNKDLPTWMDDVVKNTICSQETRWQTADELIDFINNHVKISENEVKVNPTLKTATDLSLKDLKPGMKVSPSMMLYEELGKGGFGRVFKVWHDMQRKYYAIKIFDRDASVENAISEFEALKKLEHKNIVKFIFNDRIMNGEMFYTLMELLEGENLQSYVAGDLRLPYNEIYNMGMQILDALVYMQEKDPPVYHRDIKPSNIMWDKRETFKLIDFNIATTTDDKSFAGTQPYMAPDLIKNSHEIEWDCSADTFSLGITMYQLLTHAYPWPGASLAPNIRKEPTNIRTYNDKLSDKMVEFVMKSIKTDKSQRFKTAKEMQDALAEIGQDGIIKAEYRTERKTYENEDIVNYINSLYSQSRHGNSGTRASVNKKIFDELTYTETKLDRELLNDIKALKYRLVIITGNAGDGKTSFIHQIESCGTDRKTLTSNNGSSFYLSGMRFLTNYDGSQDESDKGNNQVLDEFFRNFYDLDDYTQVKEGRIIAINEGRLVDFLSTRPRLKVLQDNIEEYFYMEGHSELLPGLMVINLNLRSVTARSKDAPSLLEQQVKKLTQKEIWTKCEGCPIADRCFIKYNVDTFQDESAGDEVINRLEWLLKTIVYKKEMHITMRDLRSMIAWMLTRDYSCEEVKKLVEYVKEEKKQEYYWQFYYFNLTAPATYEEGSMLPTLYSADRLVKLLHETDVAGVPIPAFDRDLYFRFKRPSDYLLFSERKSSLLTDFNQHNELVPAYNVKDSSVRNNLTMRHKTFIRHQYFEGTDEFKYQSRLPYRHISSFEEKLRKEDVNSIEETKQDLADAISASEGCDNKTLCKGYLMLSSSNIKDPIAKSYRRFPLDDFELFVNKTEHLTKYIEYEPDSLTFRHKEDKFIQLTVSMDLFEMLQYIKEGFSPSVNDLRGKFIELQIFKNLLEAKTYKEILVTKNNRQFTIIKLDENKKIIIEPLN